MRISIPNMNKNMTGLRKMVGGSAGTLLLDHGKGGGSSYASVEDYIETTNVNPKSLGMGLESLGKKLEQLHIKKTKPKNIKFNF